MYCNINILILQSHNDEQHYKPAAYDCCQVRLRVHDATPEERFAFHPASCVLVTMSVVTRLYQGQHVCNVCTTHA